jgi:acylphosphatase
MAKVCKRVLYSGRVQGVGFRATARALAVGFPVAGHVRNLPSGEVELVAEGEPDAVEGFLGALRSRMGVYIDDANSHDEPLADRRGFSVRH